MGQRQAVLIGPLKLFFSASYEPGIIGIRKPRVHVLPDLQSLPWSALANNAEANRLESLKGSYASRVVVLELYPADSLGDPEIARMWRYTRSNGITEGFHNKMETISRQA